MTITDHIRAVLKEPGSLCQVDGKQVRTLPAFAKTDDYGRFLQWMQQFGVDGSYQPQTDTFRLWRRSLPPAYPVANSA